MSDTTGWWTPTGESRRCLGWRRYRRRPVDAREKPEGSLAPGTCPDYGRIDQFWVTRPLAPAVIDCQLLTEPVGASDHHGVAIGIDTDQILSHESWECR